MIVPMRTSWRRHRNHAVANLAFRVFAAAGFAAGVLVALSLNVAGPAACDVAEGECLALILRHEALVHVLPPLVGLMVGSALGSGAAHAVHRLYARRSPRMG
jgi:hypothetical protein